MFNKIITAFVVGAVVDSADASLRPGAVPQDQVVEDYDTPQDRALLHAGAHLQQISGSPEAADETLMKGYPEDPQREMDDINNKYDELLGQWHSRVKEWTTQNEEYGNKIRGFSFQISNLQRGLDFFDRILDDLARKLKNDKDELDELRKENWSARGADKEVVAALEKQESVIASRQRSIRIYTQRKQFYLMLIGIKKSTIIHFEKLVDSNVELLEKGTKEINNLELQRDEELKKVQDDYDQKVAEWKQKNKDRLESQQVVTISEPAEEKIPPVDGMPEMYLKKWDTYSNEERGKLNREFELEQQAKEQQRFEDEGEGEEH